MRRTAASVAVRECSRPSTEQARAKAADRARRERAQERRLIDADLVRDEPGEQ